MIMFTQNNCKAEVNPLFYCWNILGKQADLDWKFSGIERLMFHNPNIFSYNSNGVASVMNYC